MIKLLFLTLAIAFASSGSVDLGSNITGGAGITALTGDITASGQGSVAASVVQLNGTPITSTAPATSGQVLLYNASSARWEPSSIQLPTANGSPGEILVVQNGTGQLTYTTQGAATDLSNLTSTAVNTDLVSQSNPAVFNYQGGNDANAGMLDASHIKFAQPFTSQTVGGNIGQAFFAVDALGAQPTGNLFAAIYSDSSGSPGSAIGTSDALNASTYDFTGGNAIFTFSTPVAFSAFLQYWVIIYGDATYLAGTNHLKMLGNSSFSGAEYQDGSNVWNAIPGMGLEASVRFANAASLGEQGADWFGVFTTRLQIESTDAEPTCDITGRGMIRIKEGTTGIADVMRICIKKADDSYAWATVTAI